MINRKQYGIVVFPSSQVAAQAEIKMQAFGMECRLIPLPEQIASGCGLVLQFSLDQVEKMKTSLLKEKIAVNGMYEVILSKNRQKMVMPLDTKEE